MTYSNIMGDGTVRPNSLQKELTSRRYRSERKKKKILTNIVSKRLCCLLNIRGTLEAPARENTSSKRIPGDNERANFFGVCMCGMGCPDGQQR